MKIVVITGSTRGIGFGLADAFLALGCAVTVSGRAQATVDKAVADLATRYGPDRLLGRPCDVIQPDQVQALWDAAKAHFGRVDIWINNAGLGTAMTAFWDHPPEEIEAMVTTNVIGAMFGAKVALRGMREQGSGALYNVEGLGSDGRRIAGLTLYGSTKYALAYLTNALAQEVRGTPILVGALRPGMVLTDLLVDRLPTDPRERQRTKHVLNLLTDRVETVTPWLARKVLANQKNGVHLAWLTAGRLLGRFLMTPFRKRDLFGAG
jgi:NAD(P)-dependent dehydrogenase (short-subunit alcohol dehydrogenase family)